MYRKILFILFLFTLFSFEVFSQDLVKFDWGVFVKESKNSEILLKDPFIYNTESNSKFQLRFANRSNCFFYIYYLDSDNELYFLYPDKKGEKIDNLFNTIPGTEKWFEIEKNVNEEVLYFIASHRKLDNLVNLSQQYNKWVENGSDKMIKESKYEIINELKKLVLENSQYKTIIEEAALITSDTKSLKKEILKIEKEKLYVKTIVFKSK
ncbi:MAG TPA: hypothetical protein PK771_12205 [Spirochaetota bacterium]|nr:hypothetical protein [Spirochaetota bacterium]